MAQLIPEELITKKIRIIKFSMKFIFKKKFPAPNVQINSAIFIETTFTNFIVKTLYPLLVHLQ